MIDSDGDLTKAGAFPAGKELLISAYQHGSWQGALPVGKAVIREIGDAVIAEGQFNLNSVSGREHYEAVKFTGGLQEWSYGFWPVKWNMEEVDGKQVRILESVDPIEISPVLKGAGIGTATLTIKDNDGATFVQHFETALAAVAGVVERSKSLADLRRKEGRTLSQANRSRIKELQAQLNALSTELQSLLDETDNTSKSVVGSLYLSYTRALRNLS